MLIGGSCKVGAQNSVSLVEGQIVIDGEEVTKKISSANQGVDIFYLGSINYHHRGWMSFERIEDKKMGSVLVSPFHLLTFL